jgi:hypothetical protein
MPSAPTTHRHSLVFSWLLACVVIGTLGSVPTHGAGTAAQNARARTRAALQGADAESAEQRKIAAALKKRQSKRANQVDQKQLQQQRRAEEAMRRSENAAKEKAKADVIAAANARARAAADKLANEREAQRQTKLALENRDDMDDLDAMLHEMYGRGEEGRGERGRGGSCVLFEVVFKSSYVAAKSNPTV